jgi:uncharacterized protein
LHAPAVKPLDLGSGRVCASFDPSSAAWLSFGAPHHEHGFVELSALPPFDEAGRGDPAATRRHRLAMTRGDHAFLSLTVDGASPRLEPDDSDPIAPRWSAGGIQCRATTAPDEAVIRHSWSIGAIRGRHPSVVLRLRGRIDRPALAEITERDPLDPTGATTSWSAAGQTVRVESPELPASFAVSVEDAAVEWQRSSGGGVVDGTISWPQDGDRLAFTIAVAITTPVPSPVDRLAPADGPQEADRVVRRALAYVRGCTALEVAPGERTILTDHRILPLSWTRDAYWQALALLAADGPGDRRRVADHLRWLWRRCERPDGRWMRSHHANGRRKDLAFQADQQLYPIIELADYWRVTGDVPGGVAWDVAVPRAWAATLEARDAVTGLIASEENAADDPAAAPFIAASQILFCYAAVRAAEIADAGALEFDTGALHAVAAEVRASFDRRIAGGTSAWPYAVDAAEQRVAYHDANDLPVALAPIWGFCRADDPGWTATMAFALSPANPGWVEGARPGLGSAHTHGPWTLGLIQAWIAARIIGEDESARAAQRQLEEVAFGDGMLPEAYDPDGDARVRHWFAWPGAAFAALRLLDRSGRLRERLAMGVIR